MDAKALSLFLILFTWKGTPTTADVSIRDYMACSNKTFDITLDNACQQIDEALMCLTKLLVDSGQYTDSNVCHDEEKYEYCSMLDGSMQAPMVGSKVKPLCSDYVRLKFCYERECSVSGKKFVKSYPGMETVNQETDSCSNDATRTCVASVSQVSEVNKDTCVDVAQAQGCYTDKLELCSGSMHQQFAVDTILVGLAEHIKQCVAQKYDLSKDGGICVRNPLQVLIPQHMQDLEFGREAEMITKKYCIQFHSIGDTLEEYLKKCKNSDVSQAVQTLCGLRVQCMKAGYSDQSGNRAGAQSSGMITILAAILLGSFISYKL